MLSLRVGFLRKAKGYKKHGISAVLFALVFWMKWFVYRLIGEDL